MSKMNKNIAANSIGSGALLAFFTWLFNPGEISSFISEYPKIAIGLICILLIVIGCLITLLINNWSKNDSKNIQDLYDEGRNWTHTVLIVDDIASVRAAVKDELQGFDVVDIERIDDYRQLYMLFGEFWDQKWQYEKRIENYGGCDDFGTHRSNHNLCCQEKEEGSDVGNAVCLGQRTVGHVF